MEVSASEAEERGFSSGNVSLDRVTKEQLYAAYRRTQERYTKYRTQYGDLARHYKLLERENAKARVNVTLLIKVLLYPFSYRHINIYFFFVFRVSWSKHKIKP